MYPLHPLAAQSGDTLTGVVVLDLPAPMDVTSITLHAGGVASAEFTVHVPKVHSVGKTGSGRYERSRRGKAAAGGCAACARPDAVHRKRSTQVGVGTCAVCACRGFEVVV